MDYTPISKPFVKLECDMLDSTTWVDPDVTRLFLTCLLMARPIILTDPKPAIDFITRQPDGFTIPAGEYGLIYAPPQAVIARSLLPYDKAEAALRTLGKPELLSRNAKYEGRRVVYTGHAFLALRYSDIRGSVTNEAERKRLYRARKRANVLQCPKSARTDTGQATEAEVEAEVEQVVPIDTSPPSDPLSQNLLGERGTSQGEDSAPPAQVNGSGSKAEPKPKKPKRGALSHFVPDGWKVTTELYAAAIEEGFTRDVIQRETDKFITHEFSQPRSDWDRAWINWLRKARDQYGKAATR